MGQFANTSDIATRWQGYVQSQHQQPAQAYIEEAEAIILQQYPNLQSRINKGFPKVIVTGVVVDMVKRVLQNPEGFRSEDDGDYSYDFGAGSNAASTAGTLVLSVGDKAKLNAGYGPKAVTIGPGDEKALRHLTRAPRPYESESRYSDADEYLDWESWWFR